MFEFHGLWLKGSELGILGLKLQVYLWVITGFRFSDVGLYCRGWAATLGLHSLSSLGFQVSSSQSLHGL